MDSIYFKSTNSLRVEKKNRITKVILVASVVGYIDCSKRMSNN